MISSTLRVVPDGSEFVVGVQMKQLLAGNSASKSSDALPISAPSSIVTDRRSTVISVSLCGHLRRTSIKRVAKSITEGFTLAGAGAGHFPEDVKNLIIDFVL